MPNQPPSFIPIEHDDYHAQYIGKTADGRQFFLTTPFVPALGDSPGAEFIALYTFDKAGNLLAAQIEELGPRATVDQTRSAALFQKMLDSLGQKRFGTIHVKPFSLTRFGVEFGLIPRPPEDKEDNWWVILMPGDYMAFHEPWDGTYDT